jgi:MoxR-like ATPase
VADASSRKFIQSVAGAKRILGALKKPGKDGCWWDYYWFAFYDPKVGAKKNSVQLFFYLDSGKESGNERWYYGFSVWSDVSEQHTENFNKALRESTAAIAEYFRNAPTDTVIKLGGDDEEEDEGDEVEEVEEAEGGTEGEMEGDVGEDEEDEREYELAVKFAERLAASDGVAGASFGTSYGITVQRVYDGLDSLPKHADGLVEEVGEFFTWAWPLFQASCTGRWGEQPPVVGDPQIAVSAAKFTLEGAPSTLEELSDSTSLSIQFLEDLQEALLARQQVVLVGPPGTSKTFLAQAFGRYFAQAREGHAEGTCDTLYMHASWTYEDFFEGIRPATTDGGLCFEPKKGFFLKWVEKLPKDSSARHVLVLDEINRCDTAAVLGELLQLLEYRGVEVGLLSGSPFILPRNLYVIGTMNSADRSIGRMDLALRRRFFWMNLYPDAEILRRWLERRGNNPAGFDAKTLEECNTQLEKHQIPREQHIGHALFMGQQAGPADVSPRDKPLDKEHLTRIVRFSVMPYLHELFLSQYGKVDQALCESIQAALLKCLGEG